MADRYFPTRELVSARNGSNRSRALGHPYWVPSEFARSATDDLVEKLRQRCTPDGALRCYLCGTVIGGDDEWHLDHVHPLALGGTHEVDNLEPACTMCNLTKADLRLEDFIGPDRAARWRSDGWPPPFTKLSAQPTSALWERSPRLARRLARRPREVDPHPDVRWRRAGGTDRQIAAVLLRRPDPWLAVPIGEIADDLGRKSGPIDQAWNVAMGLFSAESKPGYLDRRYVPSEFIVATRAKRRSGPVGPKAFRLRFDVDATTAAQPLLSPDRPGRPGGQEEQWDLPQR